MEHQIIHILLGKANPNRMNGVNKVVNSLAEHQSRLGARVSVWGITKNPQHDYPARSYRTVLFKDVGKFRLDPLLKEAIRYQEGKAVTFHLHGGFIPQLSSIASLLGKLHLTYVFTPHGAYNTVAMKRSKWKKKLYVKFFESKLVERAKSIHLIGQSEVEGTQETFGKVPYHLIPNGQETSFSFKNSNNRNRIPVFGFIGRLDSHTKGLDLLLKAYASFVASYRYQSNLWLIGDGEDRKALEEMARDLKLEAHMKFFGAKYGQEKKALMEQMDFLCLTSRNEGLPGVVLEAAAAAVPSMVSVETNLGEYISQNQAGFVLKENSTAHICDAFLKAYHSWKVGTVETLAINAQEMVKKHFDWSHISQQHLNAYVA